MLHLSRDTTYGTGSASRWTLAALGTLLLVLMASVTGTARADFGVQPGTFDVSLSTHQAGGHPDLVVTQEFNTFDNGGQLWTDENVKNIKVDLPAGIIGDTTAVPQCDPAHLAPPVGCPRGSQVGILRVKWFQGGAGLSDWVDWPIYNLRPPAGVTAELSATISTTPTPLFVRVRSESDYGLTTELQNTPVRIPIEATQVVLWGVPGDHTNNSVPRRAFLTNPSSCGSLDAATTTVTSWQHPSDSRQASAAVGTIDGCEKLPATSPKATVAPETNAAGAPSAYDIDLDLPQSENPHGVASPPLRRVAIALPKGTAISPGSADGLAGCADDQLHVHDRSPVACPDASKIGTVSITTPFLAEPLEGAMYLGQPHPGDQFRLFLAVEGSGVTVRLRGSAVPDPKTGDLTAIFQDLPPIAFSHLHVHLKGGPRAVLANPQSCGATSATTTVTPVGGGADESSTNTFTVGGDCAAAQRFAPQVTAGTTNPLAGADSPFVLQILRGDGEQDLQTIGVALPAGLIGKVAGLPLCPAAAAAAGTCAESSRVGDVSVKVGSGAAPITLGGKAYMTEGSGGAPFGLSFVVPARIGPFDFGNVVVRASVMVDPLTGALRVQTDPLPSIIAGIPLHYRSVAVRLDRPGFMRNPTSCLEQAIGASLTSTSGAVATPAMRFQVGGCGALKLAPSLKMTFNGSKEHKRGGKPGLSFAMTQRPGESNLRAVAVTLPSDVGLALGLPNPCTMAQFTARACPASSKLGDSSVTTPLLDGPLQGGVYLVEAAKKGALPRLGVLLNGQVPISLLSTVTTGKHLTTTFAAPDLPIRTFKLTLNAKTALTTTRDLCSASQRAVVAIQGASGARKTTTVTAPVQGCKGKKRSSIRRASRR